MYTLLLIIAWLVLIVCVAARFVPDALLRDENDAFNALRAIRKIGWKIPALIVFVLHSFSSVKTLWEISTIQLPGSSVGIILTNGKPSPELLEPGLNFKVPYFQQIVIKDLRMQKTTISTGSASSDKQSVQTVVSAMWHPEKSATYRLYTAIGDDIANKLVQPNLIESIKSVTTRYKAEELLTKRQIVRDEIVNTLQTKIKSYGIVIDELAVEDLSFSEEYTDAIEATTTAQQLRIKAQEDLERIRIEGEQKVVQAKADAEAARLRAQTVTDRVLMDKAIEKWDGVLPLSTGGAMPFLDLVKLKEASTN